MKPEEFLLRRTTLRPDLYQGYAWQRDFPLRNTTRDKLLRPYNLKWKTLLSQGHFSLPRCNENKSFYLHRLPGIDVPIRLQYRELKTGESRTQSPQFSLVNAWPIVTIAKQFTRKKMNSSRRESTNNRSVDYQKLMDQNNWTQAELARQLGKSRAWITKVLKG